MKNLYILLLLFLGSVAFAQDKNDLTLILIDGYTNNELANFEVFVSSTKEKTNTDEKGQIVLKNFKGKRLKTTIETEDERFCDFDGTFNLKIYPSRRIKIYLYPTTLYEKQMLALHDSIYGIDDFEAKYKEGIEQETDSSEVIQASYPGGIQEMMNFISFGVIYPAIATEMGDQGNCYVQFIVAKNGFVSHVSVIRGVSKEIEQEAKRVVRAMPFWKPGTIYGEPVRSKFTLPIQFRLR